MTNEQIAFLILWIAFILCICIFLGIIFKDIDKKNK